MGIVRDSFVFFRSFHDATKELPADLYKEVMTAFAAYALDGNEAEMSPVCKALFMLAKPNMDNAAGRYAASVENGKRGAEHGKKGAEHGKKGGRPRKITPQETGQKPPNNPPKSPPITPLNDDVDVNEDDNIGCKYVDKKRAREEKPHVLPSYQEIMDQNYVDAYVQLSMWKFIKHCQLGGNTMTNDRLLNLIVALDFDYGKDEIKKAAAIETAINKGYYDIKKISI